MRKISVEQGERRGMNIQRCAA